MARIKVASHKEVDPCTTITTTNRTRQLQSGRQSRALDIRRRLNNTGSKKGKSGNPRGRPKNAQSKRKIAEKVLLEEHEVLEGGRPVRRAALDLVLRILSHKAFAGDNRAFKALEKLDLQYDPQEPTSVPGYLVVPGRLTKESWVELFSPKRSFYEEEE